MKITPQFVPLSFCRSARDARNQGVIKVNETGFAEELERELTRLSVTETVSEKARNNSPGYAGNEELISMWESTRCFYL